MYLQTPVCVIIQSKVIKESVIKFKKEEKFPKIMRSVLVIWQQLLKELLTQAKDRFYF